MAAGKFVKVVMAAALAVMVGTSTAGEFTDKRNSKKYKTVTIGKQTWMAENVNVEIGNSWCYGNDESNCAKYGRIYDWNTAKKACPSGWHLPSREEWTTLVDYAGGSSTAGTNLKSKSGWNDDEGKSGNGTDKFGFSALPGGLRHNSAGSFLDDGDLGYWWTATEYGSGYAYYRDMNYDRELVRERNDSKSYGFSVRCAQY